jgi:HNH endonuclease
MLPELNKSQNVYIEITNLEHGGPGWELGTTLWSPVYNKTGKAKSWRIMERLRPGDLVLHLVTIKNQYNWTGVSLVSTRLTTVADEPPRPSSWAGMSPYQRASLEKYSTLAERQPISRFFSTFEEKLKEEYQKSGLFYVLYGEKDELRVAQRYLAGCPRWLYVLFDEFSNELGFTPNLDDSHSHLPTQNEPSHPDYSAPGRVSTVVSRIIRDTKLSRDLKKEYQWKCQICGTQIPLPGGRVYAEGHHLRPLGGDHCGPDIRENILILCPNHHTEFDYGAIAIDPKTMMVVHVDSHDQHHMKGLAYHRDDISADALNYHHSRFFGKPNKMSTPTSER